MKKMVISVLIFMVLVMGITFLLITLYTPIETPDAFDGSGFTLSDAGTSEPCQIHLGGTLSSYRFGLKPPSFSSNPLYSTQGLIINDSRYLGKFVVGWPNEDSNYVTYISDGTRFYTDRNLSFVVAILPKKHGVGSIAIAPAASEEDALTLLEQLTASEQFKNRSPASWEYLRTYLK